MVVVDVLFCVVVYDCYFVCLVGWFVLLFGVVVVGI